MAVYSVGARTASAPTATLPAISLYSAAAVKFDMLEIGISNTTAIACVVGLCRLTTTGTQGTGLTEAALSEASVGSSCQAFNSHTVGPTLVDLGYRWSLGAAVGAGVIWTWQDGELEALVGTTHGVGVFCPTGTGQILDVYMKWIE